MYTFFYNTLVSLPHFLGPLIDGKYIISQGRIDYFTVVYSVTWPLNGSEAASDLVLIKTLLVLLSKSNCSNASLR